MKLSIKTPLFSGLDKSRDFEVIMTHHSAGAEIAGSGTRETKEKYSVSTIVNGTRHSKSFASKTDAFEEFFKRTGDGPMEKLF